MTLIFLSSHNTTHTPHPNLATWTGLLSLLCLLSSTPRISSHQRPPMSTWRHPQVPSLAFHVAPPPGAFPSLPRGATPRCLPWPSTWRHPQVPSLAFQIPGFLLRSQSTGPPLTPGGMHVLERTAILWVITVQLIATFPLQCLVLPTAVTLFSASCRRLSTQL
ncbi:hypothetical protein V1264_008830 [Littorina saxatilis]|uniref:Uncharacterized protein n=1 Tax=Littorina saxatilis TaxID=31220 RepID=A0AAN9AQE3_9CAEN